jgi:superfamily II DNA or RNA helicase
MRVTPDLIDEIAVMIQDRGELTKEEILAAWPMSEDEYTFIRERLLAKHGIGKKRGALIATSSRRGRRPEESSADEIALRSSWEIAAVDRLRELLQHSQLEKLLGRLLHTIRQSRKYRTGADRRGTKHELASALVVQHGQDLFCDPNVRKEIGAACKVKPPGRWHPGKGGAVNFVNGTGFPIEFAGVQSVETRPSFEMLHGRVELKPLWPFQKEVQRELLNRLYQPGDRGLVTLPTGAGKTRVAVESIRYWLAGRYDACNNVTERGLAIWLAHTEELCEQAYSCFKQVWEAETQSSPLMLVRFWRRYTSTREEIDELVHQSELVPSVVISTPQRLVNLIRGKIERGPETISELGTATGLIVIDEAHRAAARSYREILSVMTIVGQRVSVVGLTATPFRMEYLQEDSEQGTRELREIFKELIEPRESLGMNAHARLQEMGVLSKPRFEILETTTAFSLPLFDSSDYDEEARINQIDRILAMRTDRSPRRILIHERLTEAAAEDGASILYFGPSVRDAECMAYLLRARGVPSAVVTGTTRDAARREVIADFKAGRIKVLCNCEVLTTGFDAPRVTHVFMARPTVSQVLYEQMVGRGLRGAKFGGTEQCTIIDCKDSIQGPRPQLGYESFRQIWDIR